MSVTEQQRREIVAYIQRWDGHLDTHFAGVELADKRLLVVGSGWGTETLWALRRGAAAVVGLDPRSDERGYVEAALAERGQQELARRFDLHAATTMTIGEVGTFDLILSNNTFEHVVDLAGNLAAMRRFIPTQGARIHILAGPLFLSSAGHHLPIGPWDHLGETQASIRARVSPRQWSEYRDGLNGMTITDFLSAVREAGLVLTELGILPDPAIDRLEAVLPALPPGLKPMDLALQAIRCTLAFPENLASGIAATAPPG